MVRLTREESRAATRECLIVSATLLFRRDGYATTSIERIAETAGFSKGAVYSNFESKEAIFLTVLDRQGTEGLDRVLAAIDAAESEAGVVDALANWADGRSSSGTWSLTILEHARLAGPEAHSLARQRDVLSGHWRRLGECVRARLPRFDVDATSLGALLHEIAYAPALTFMDQPKAGDLMRITLGPWVRPAL